MATVKYYSPGLYAPVVAVECGSLLFVSWERINIKYDSQRVLLERRLRWLVEVLCGNRVFCWWLLSMGLVAMMSLHLFIKASLVLSLTVEGNWIHSQVLQMHCNTFGEERVTGKKSSVPGVSRLFKHSREFSVGKKPNSKNQSARKAGIILKIIKEM